MSHVHSIVRSFFGFSFRGSILIKNAKIRRFLQSLLTSFKKNEYNHGQKS